MFINIPATIFATCFYELVFKDSLDKIALGHAEHEDGTDGLARHLSKMGLIGRDDRLLRRETSSFGRDSKRS